MLEKWIEEYQKEFQKTQFWSQLASFLLTIFAVLSVKSLWQFYYSEYGFDPPSDFGELFLTPALLHLTVGFVFALRFALLFSKSKKSFLAAQILWLIGFTVFISWWIYSIKSELNGRAFGLHPEYHLFMADRFFSPVSIIYLLISPMKEIDSVIRASFRVNRKFTIDKGDKWTDEDLQQAANASVNCFESDERS